MKAGTDDKKKVAALAVLFAVLGYFLYANVFASSTPSSASSSRESAKAVAPPVVPASTDVAARATPAKASARNLSDEFLPVLHSKRTEERIDPMSVDPTLRLGRLAKLEEVAPAGSGRNLFTMGQAPPPKPVGPEPVVRVAAAHRMGPQEIPVPVIAGPPPPPPMPPITFRYYGFSTVRRDGKKTAFFLIGEDVTVKAVGDMVDRVYRLLSIGLTSAVVEDTQSKRTQTVPLAEEAQS
jgi:hypothetical protein